MAILLFCIDFMLKLFIPHYQPKSDPNDNDSGVFMILYHQIFN